MPQQPDINITGTATVAAISFTPTSLTFPSQAAGTASAPQAITVTNTGTAALTFTGIAIAGPNKADFNWAGDHLHQHRHLGLRRSMHHQRDYKPAAAAGTSTAMVIVADNARAAHKRSTSPARPRRLRPSAYPEPRRSQWQFTDATVTAGKTATYSLQISANQNVSSVSFTCTGAPTAATCPVPATVALTANTPAAVTVTVSTTARGMLAPQSEPATRMQPPAAIQMLPLSVLAVLLLIITLLAATQSPAGRLRFARVALSVCLVLMPIVAATLLVGCGGGSSSTPPPPVTGTPAGTYTITVTATSGSTTATTQLTLVVQ